MSRYPSTAADPLAPQRTDYTGALLVEMQALTREQRKTKRAAQTCATVLTVWFIVFVAAAIWIFLRVAMSGPSPL